ncbi:probable glutamate receptor [Parasteatoda tepidariorum]|uniref:probable glutamate receptor n=1 Tax=Parasteatoda tepidariorum TaxID=114398 RepID=UPI0039BC5EA1
MLKIAVLVTKVLNVTRNEKGQSELSGVDGKFINLLMSAMKTPFEIQVPLDGQWGQQTDNGSWTGLMGMVQRGEADLAISQLSITEERSQAVNFSIPYTDQPVKFAAPAPKRISSLFVYLYPFDLTVWLSCISVILILPFIHVLFLPERQTYSAALLKVFSSLLKQPLYTQTKSMHKFCILLCLIFSMVISFSYCAVLLSFLSIPLYEPKLRTFNDLSRAVLRGHLKCQVTLGSFILPFLLHSKDEQLRNVGELVQKNSWSFQVKNYQNKSVDDRTATVSSFLTLQSLYKGYKNVVFSENTLVTTHVGIAMRKGFCCERKLNIMISRIKKAGLYEKIKSDEFKTVMLKSRKTFTGKTYAICIQDIYGVLLLLTAGYLLSIAALVGELLWTRFKKSFKYI